MKTKRIFTIINALFIIVLQSLTVLAADRGANVPFKTYEAEEGIPGNGASIDVNPAIKGVSSEKSYVHLSGTGQNVEFISSASANRLTLRYSIPRNSGGTVSLYLNGVHNQDITLTSDQNYDSLDVAKTRCYDEKSVIINITQGDRVKIQKDVADVCSWYGIDLIDLETAPTPLAMPENFLSIAEFGATGNDTSDDTQAIKNCITAAASQGKGVWIPSGIFCQNTRITLPANLDLMGAGIWYSVLHNTVHGTNYSNDIGYALISGSTISDIKFTGVALARKLAANLFRPIRTNAILKNLWIQNVGGLYGWDSLTYGAENIVFRDSRVIGTYYDGVHWGDGGSYNNLVENVFFRGLGDDAIAQVNRADMPLCHDNVAKFNTIIASYSGRGLANIGGDNLTFTDNIISSCSYAGIMIATEPLSPSISRPINGFQCLRNTIRKCSHEGYNHAGIHVWLKVNPMQNVVIKDNIIEYGATEGIHIDNTDFGDAGGRTIFESNIVRFNLKTGYNNTSNDVNPILIRNNGFFGDYTTGLSNELNNSIKIYPNPVKDNLEIESNIAFDSISIYANTGKKICTHKYDQKKTHANLSLSYLSAGMYVVEISSDRMKYTRKIIRL